MSFRDIDSTASAVAYVQRLNTKWPERSEIMDEITAQVKTLQNVADSQTSADSAYVAELCCGAGNLGFHLLSKLAGLAYIGLDQSEPLLAAAAERLVDHGGAILIQADLNSGEWPDLLPDERLPLDAVVSMQSLHDLGGEAEVSRIYQVSHDALKPGGIFINADLIVEPGQELPNNPGRLTIDRHLALLREFGYTSAECTLQTGGFGCIMAVK